MSPPATTVLVVALVSGLLALAVLVPLVAARRSSSRDRTPATLRRAEFVEAAQEVLGSAPGGAVAIVDVGLRTQVADTLGHTRADAAVALAADRLAGIEPDLPPGSRVARLAGDTFALVVPAVGAGGVDVVFRGVRTRMARPAVVDGLPFGLPVALGVAVDVPADGLADGPADGRADGSGRGVDAAGRVGTLLARADVALAAARRDGGGLRRYDPGLGERAARRRALARGFAEGLAQGQIRVHYQPLVGLHRGAVVGVEALARWEHPELGSLLPDEFVPVLESSGQLDALTTFVLDESLAAARRWLDRGLRLSVAVNVSAATAALPGFPVRVAAALGDHEVPPELLTLELTESGVAAEREAAGPALVQLSSLGCRLAVDDFGTGQSSLAHLRALPIDQIKIDKSFVLGMESERGNTAIVRAIVVMAHTLGMSVVAEGVERPAVRSALREMGCDVAQGYLVSRPLAAGSLESWMATLTVASGAGREGGPLTLIA